ANIEERPDAEEIVKTIRLRPCEKKLLSKKNESIIEEQHTIIQSQNITDDKTLDDEGLFRKGLFLYSGTEDSCKLIDAIRYFHKASDQQHSEANKFLNNIYLF